MTLPIDIADEIEEVTAATRRGFGSVRVKVTIGATTWSTSVFPDNRSRSYVLPVKKQVRNNEGLRDGDPVTVTMEVIHSATSSA